MIGGYNTYDTTSHCSSYCYHKKKMCEVTDNHRCFPDPTIKPRAQVATPYKNVNFLYGTGGGFATNTCNTADYSYTPPLFYMIWIIGSMLWLPKRDFAYCSCQTGSIDYCTKLDKSTIPRIVIYIAKTYNDTSTFSIDTIYFTFHPLPSSIYCLLSPFILSRHCLISTKRVL